MSLAWRWVHPRGKGASSRKERFGKLYPKISLHLSRKMLLQERRERIVRLVPVLSVEPCSYGSADSHGRDARPPVPDLISESHPVARIPS